MRRVAIVQARMGSTRLPGKVLMDLGGRPMLACQLERLRRCRLLDELVLATTRAEQDRPLVELAEREGVRWFRGDEADVLGRYLGAAREARAEVVVRITADCPLIDPAETDRVVAALEAEPGCDYAANVLQRTYPRGLDSEALFRDTLERLGRLARSPGAREHVTTFIRAERPELFVVRSVTDEQDNSDLRWTVDAPQDLALVRRLWEQLGLGQRHVPYRELLAWVRAHPELSALNAELAPPRS